MSRISKISAAICSVAIIIGVAVTDFREEFRTSQTGLELIGDSESCMREPYYCPAGIATDGMGNTTNVHADKTDKQIAKDFVNNVKISEQCVNRFANGEQLPQSVFDAVVSITFNVGCTKMRSSTMYRYLNNGEYVKACHEFPRWNKAGGKVLNGLVIRREKEMRLCLSDISQY